MLKASQHRRCKQLSSRTHLDAGTGDKCPFLSYFASTPDIVRTSPTHSNPFSYDQLTEESIIQRNSINPPHTRIPQKLRINIKENRHIHRLPLIQPLLLKAKTLYLAKIRRHLRRRHTIRRDADNILLFTLVRGSIEGERGLAGEDADLALLRGELPGQDVGGGAGEGDA